MHLVEESERRGRGRGRPEERGQWEALKRCETGGDRASFSYTQKTVIREPSDSFSNHLGSREREKITMR